jgi:hypothetical protein
MVKRWGVPIVLAVGLVAVAGLLRGKGGLPKTPEDTIDALFDAAGRGDAAAYVRLLTGELKTTVESTRSQLGAEAYAESLRRTVSGIKGRATSRGGGDSSGSVALDVTLVFVDRHELQRFLLVEQGGGWAIAAISRAEMRKPPVAYGTPVFDEPAPTPSSTGTSAGAKP